MPVSADQPDCAADRDGGLALADNLLASRLRRSGQAASASDIAMMP